MRITLASDLHFEFHKGEPGWMPTISPNCDVLVLAGDIGVGRGAIEAVLNISQKHPQAHILFVAGNHEFYKQNIDQQLAIYKRTFEGHDRVHFLENTSVVIGGFTFLGCTLWSGFDVLGSDYSQAAMDEASRVIADFSVIKTGDGNSLFTPEDARNRYAESCIWLEQELSQCDAEKTVVVTHFSPCKKAANYRFNESLITAYFSANCQRLIERYQPALWCYGHNHLSDDLMIGHTRLVSNQLGYPSEQFSTNYRADLGIEI